jgi:hypothetical protein
MISKTKRILLITAGFIMPVIALAAGNPNQIIPDNPGGILPGTGQETLTGEIYYFIKLFLQIVGLIAVAYIIYGGFRYVTAGGNDETVAAAKKTLINSIIGLVIIILSYTIVNIVVRTAFGEVGNTGIQ